MTAAQLTASQKLWTAREKFRYTRWRHYVKTKRANDPLRVKWHRLWAEAHLARLHRDKQLAKIPASKVSSAMVHQIAEWEGGRGSDGLFHPYRDAVGVWTIGYGHTENVSAKSKSLTQPEAETLLQHDLDNKYAPAVVKYAKKYNLALNQNQLDALVSFAYNLGWGYFERGHTIGDAMAAHSYSAIANGILLYDKAGGRALPGLTNRRHAESAWFKK